MRFLIFPVLSRKRNDLLQFEIIDKLPDLWGKNAFISWINQGVTNIADLRMRTTAYFTGLMEQPQIPSAHARAVL